MKIWWNLTNLGCHCGLLPMSSWTWVQKNWTLGDKKAFSVKEKMEKLEYKIWKCTNNQSGYLASAKPKPGSLRDALEEMEESAVRDGENPGDCVSGVPAHHHLAETFICGFYQRRSSQNLIVCGEKVDPGEVGVDLPHRGLLRLPLTHQTSSQTTPGRPDTTEAQG